MFFIIIDEWKVYYYSYQFVILKKRKIEPGKVEIQVECCCPQHFVEMCESSETWALAESN